MVAIVFIESILTEIDAVVRHHAERVSIVVDIKERRIMDQRWISIPSRRRHVAQAARALKAEFAGIFSRGDD